MNVKMVFPLSTSVPMDRHSRTTTHPGHSANTSSMLTVHSDLIYSQPDLVQTAPVQTVTSRFLIAVSAMSFITAQMVWMPTTHVLLDCISPSPQGTVPGRLKLRGKVVAIRKIRSPLSVMHSHVPWLTSILL